MIRNALAKAAQYPLLLFMDCDADLPDGQFLERYHKSWDLPIDAQVICGGRVYPPRPQEPALQLHWLYGSRKESQPAARRKLAPNRSFMTNNFLISKSIFTELAFNEELKGYGHEDTLFGWELCKQGIAIQHIENPVIHAGLETAEAFMHKTVEGVANLHRLYRILGTKEEWYAEISLLRFFLRLKRLQLAAFTYHILSLFNSSIERQLQTAKPSLVLFDLFKLYHLLRQDRLS